MLLETDAIADVYVNWKESIVTAWEELRTTPDDVKLDILNAATEALESFPHHEQFSNWDGILLVAHLERCRNPKIIHPYIV